MIPDRVRVRLAILFTMAVTVSGLGRSGHRNLSSNSFSAGSRSHHLPPTHQTAGASGTTHPGTLEETLENLERELILDALKSSRGNCAKAARRLGFTERVMGLRVKKHEIDPKRLLTGR